MSDSVGPHWCTWLQSQQRLQNVKKVSIYTKSGSPGTAPELLFRAALNVEVNVSFMQKTLTRYFEFAPLLMLMSQQFGFAMH